MDGDAAQRPLRLRNLGEQPTSDLPKVEALLRHPFNLKGSAEGDCEADERILCGEPQEESYRGSRRRAQLSMLQCSAVEVYCTNYS